MLERDTGRSHHLPQATSELPPGTITNVSVELSSPTTAYSFHGDTRRGPRWLWRRRTEPLAPEDHQAPPPAGVTPNRRRRSLHHEGGRDVHAAPATAAAPLSQFRLHPPIRSRHRRRPAPASIPHQTKRPLRAGSRSGHGPTGSGSYTSRRHGGRPASASHAVGPKRPRPPQPTSEERRKATSPPSPWAGRVAGDPLWQRRGVGERASGGGGGGVRFGGAPASPERERRGPFAYRV
ncbi:unnamed protein product [Urochloa humidicola]